MAEIKGEIAFLDTREITSKKNGRKYTAYALKLKLDNGELSERIDAGFKKPEFDKGDYVVITTKQNGQYEQLDTIVAAQRPVAAAPAISAVGAAASPADEGTDRQTQIVLQHSQEMALREVALLLANDALPLSKADNKAGIAKRYEEITKAVDKLTVQRYFDVVSGRLLDSVADAGDVDLQPDGQIPAQANSTPTAGEDD